MPLEAREAFALRALLVAGMLTATTFCTLILNGCQSEFDKTIPPPEHLVLKSSSEIVTLIQRTSLRDGSYDNIIDKASCISLKFPVTVIANGQSVEIETAADLMQVENIFDEVPGDADVLEFVFPITVVKSDHEEVVVSNYDEFNNIASECQAGDDEDIECIDFNYPLNLSVYDSDNQIADIVTIENDKELYNFFEALVENVLVGFQFPITMTTASAEEILVHDNNEMKLTIEEHVNDCDEDDDNDYNDDDTDDALFIRQLTFGTWKITEFTDESDHTSDFQNYSFTFFSDNTASASDVGSSVSGSWDTYGDNGLLLMDLDFGSDEPLSRLQEDWDVVEYTATVIRLRHTEENEAIITSLVFEKE